MLPNAIATVILAGMMLIPFVNVVVAAIVGAGLAGPFGSLFGILLAVAITAAETTIAQRMGWREVASASEEPGEIIEDHRSERVAETTAPPTIRTGPATGRRKLQQRAAGRETAARPRASSAQIERAQ